MQNSRRAKTIPYPKEVAWGVEWDKRELKVMGFGRWLDVDSHREGLVDSFSLKLQVI